MYVRRSDRTVQLLSTRVHESSPMDSTGNTMYSLRRQHRTHGAGCGSSSQWEEVDAGRYLYHTLTGNVTFTLPY